MSTFTHQKSCSAINHSQLKLPAESPHTHTLTDTHTHSHTHSLSHIHTHTHTHTHALSHTHTHTHTQTHTHTHTHTYPETLISNVTDLKNCSDSFYNVVDFKAVCPAQSNSTVWCSLMKTPRSVSVVLNLEASLCQTANKI